MCFLGFNECKIEGFCDQICTYDREKSFNCSCTMHYQASGKHCHAINDPVGESASILYTIGNSLKRLTVLGESWHGRRKTTTNSTRRSDGSHIKLLPTKSRIITFDYSFQNRSICYIEHDTDSKNLLNPYQLVCRSIDDFNSRWVIQISNLFLNLKSKFFFVFILRSKLYQRYLK